MKKLTHAVVAAVLVASTLAYAAEDTAVQTVDGTVTETISLSVSGGATITLDPAVANTTTTATLTVNSTTKYTIRAKADAEATKGANANKLFEYDTTGTPGYVTGGRYVDAVPNIAGAAAAVGGAAGSGADGAIDTTGVLIFTGTGAELDGKVDATLTQVTPYGTQMLVEDSKYRMVITYTATTSGV